MVSRAGEANPFSTATSLVTYCDVRGSILVDYLGSHGRVGLTGIWLAWVTGAIAVGILISTRLMSPSKA